MNTLSKKKILSKVAIYIVVIAVAIAFFSPLLWMVGTSLKEPTEIFSTDSGLFPKMAKWGNYLDMFNRLHFSVYLKNTLITSVIPTFAQLIAAPLAAYSISLVPWKGKKILFPLILFTMMIPSQVTQIPLYGIWSNLKLTNTFVPLILPAFFGSAYYIFLLRQFMAGLPKSLIEAAKIDGASQFRILYQIIYPLCKPVLVTVGLLSFMGSWNELMGPLIYLFDGDKYTLALGLQRFLSTNAGKQWNLLMAASTVFTAPIVVLFFFGQKYFIQGIVTTGIK